MSHLAPTFTIESYVDMKVRDLIAELNKYPADFEVEVGASCSDDHYYWGRGDLISVEEEEGVILLSDLPKRQER